jgi:hypothetical protein
MKEKSISIRIIFIIGVIALIIGAIDPMEGSIIIATGSVCIALSTLLTHDRYRKIFLAAAIMIFVGVLCMWYVSSLGGFDPKREWWWDALILPYPIGWLIVVSILIIRAFKKNKQQPPAPPSVMQ